MKLCDVTFPGPEQNLACDEALLERCEAGHCGDLLRFWEPQQYFVVLGYANKAEREVNLPFCRARGFPVLRRCTGGGTVLQGPGVLNYTLLLRFDEAGSAAPEASPAASPFHSISATNEFILKRHQAALAALTGAGVQRLGQTDLAIGGLKFSGNAQRRQRRFLIYHGTFLLDLDVSLVEQALPMPSREPEYRARRSHTVFLMNLKLPAVAIKSALRAAWHADAPLAEVPLAQVDRLVREKYSRDEWNLKF